VKIRDAYTRDTTLARATVSASSGRRIRGSGAVAVVHAVFVPRAGVRAARGVVILSGAEVAMVWDIGHILKLMVVGFFVGLLARALHPGDDKMGIFATSFLGIAGSLVANYAGHALHFYKQGETASWIGATVGAIVLLVIGHAIRRMAN
jgi:uncharacterized membrane protein YeaQ/YmgE (transglycosylase-associated protein family)